jgi:hypothetical protein
LRRSADGDFFKLMFRGDALNAVCAADTIAIFHALEGHLPDNLETAARLAILRYVWRIFDLVADGEFWLRHSALCNEHLLIPSARQQDYSQTNLLPLSAAALLPAVSKGFGTELIERELKSTFGARVFFDYAPAGIEVKISIPIERT